MSTENNWLPTEKNIEDYSLLENMLQAQKQEFDIFKFRNVKSGLHTYTFIIEHFIPS